MSDNAGTTPGGLTDILRALPGSKLMHPSMESYLVLQTSRLQAGQEPIDSVIDGSYYWSWLEGKFTVGQSGHAPAGCWLGPGRRSGQPESGQSWLPR